MNTDPTPTHTMNPILKHLLETNLQQQWIIQELALGLYTTTKEVPALCKLNMATAIPLGDPCQDIQPHGSE